MNLLIHKSILYHLNYHYSPNYYLFPDLNHFLIEKHKLNLQKEIELIKNQFEEKQKIKELKKGY